MFGNFGHLVRRFFGSLNCRDLGHVQNAWVENVLSTVEYELWLSQSSTDRYHTFFAARRVELELANDTTLADDDTRWVIAAALLHDIGKLDSNLGTLGRVAATLVGLVMPATALGNWCQKRGLRKRISSYLNHAEIGAELLQNAQSDGRVVTWVRQHHQPHGDTPLKIAQLLKRADHG